MRAADIATASILMLLGVVVLVEAIRLGFRWGPDGPQSGFFPFWLAVVVIAHTAAILVQAVRKHSTEPFASRQQLRMVLTVAWPAAAMVLFTHFIGLYVAGAVYLFFYMRLVECRSARDRSRPGGVTDLWASTTSSSASMSRSRPTT